MRTMLFVALAFAVSVLCPAYAGLFSSKGEDEFSRALESTSAREASELLDDSADKGFGAANLVKGCLYEYGTHGAAPDYILRYTKSKPLSHFGADEWYYPKEGIALKLVQDNSRWSVQYFKGNYSDALKFYAKAKEAGISEADKAMDELKRRVRGKEVLAKEKNEQQAIKERRTVEINRAEKIEINATCETTSGLYIINDRICARHKIRLGEALSKYSAQALSLPKDVVEQMFSAKANGKPITFEGNDTNFKQLVGHLSGDVFIVDTLILQNVIYLDANRKRMDNLECDFRQYDANTAAPCILEKIGIYDRNDSRDITCTFTWKNEFIRFSEKVKKADNHSTLRCLTISGMPPKLFVVPKTKISEEAARLEAEYVKRKEYETARMADTRLEAYINKYANATNGLSLFKVQLGGVVDANMIQAFQIDFGFEPSFVELKEEDYWRALEEFVLKTDGRVPPQLRPWDEDCQRGLPFAPLKYLSGYNRAELIITPITHRIAAITAYYKNKDKGSAEDVVFKIPLNVIFKTQVPDPVDLEEAFVEFESQRSNGDEMSLDTAIEHYEELTALIAAKCGVQPVRHEDAGVRKMLGGSYSFQYEVKSAFSNVNCSDRVGRYSTRLSIHGKAYKSGTHDTSVANYGRLYLRLEDPVLMKSYYAEIDKLRARSEAEKKQQQQDAREKVVKENLDIL